MDINQPLSWDNSIRKPWSLELLKALSLHKADLDAGNPEDFVAGYSTISEDRQLKFWAELIIAMAKFESSWKPTAVFHEPPPLGVDSIGLLQLSYQDQPIYHLEPLDPARDSLKDPLINLRCGIKILAHWLVKDKVVASSAGGHHRGAARYWSVVREGATHHLREIKQLTKVNTGL